MANNNCTSSVHELLENVKGTPYGVEVRRSKKGKPQAISFNETVDSFKDVIEDDCSNADKHGRFADTPASEGGAVGACEQYEADKAPCFSVGGKIKSTTVLKSRLAKKYKEKDSYEEYEDNKYKALEKSIKTKVDIDEIINFRLNYYSQILSYFTGSKISGSGHFFSINGNGKYTSAEIEEKFIQDIQRDKARETDNPRLNDSGYKKAHKAIKELTSKIIKGKKMIKRKKKSKPVKSKKTIAKKKPTPKKQSSIPSEIYYQKTADGKCILFLTKVWYNKMYQQYQKQIKEYFKWNPYDKFWKCKKKGAESILQKMQIPERNSSPLRTVTPEKVKPTKKKFALATQTRSIGQGNQQQLGLSFVSRLERLERNEKSIANVIIAMKPKIDKIEEDVEVIKQIVEVEHHNKGLQGDVF